MKLRKIINCPICQNSNIKKIAPIKSWGGCDIDFEWQIPTLEYWLKKNEPTH